MRESPSSSTSAPISTSLAVMHSMCLGMIPHTRTSPPAAVTAAI